MTAGRRATIRVQLRELAQLFNSMDPSPFHDRDLDADAEEFIVGWAMELPAGEELELHLRLSQPIPPERVQHVGPAVRHYFEERAAVKQREFRLLMRRGRTSLAVGLVFLTVCLTTAEVLATYGDSTFAAIVREGFTIAGWVAMWGPFQLYLYDWWPVRAERRVLERLARMEVRLDAPVDETASTVGSSPPVEVRRPGAG